MSIFPIMTSFDLHVHFDLFVCFSGAYSAPSASINVAFGSYCTPDSFHKSHASSLVCVVACRDIVSQYLAFAHTFALLKRVAPSILYHYVSLDDAIRLIYCATVTDPVAISLQNTFCEAFQMQLDIIMNIQCGSSQTIISSTVGVSAHASMLFQLYFCFI